MKNSLLNYELRIKFKQSLLKIFDFKNEFCFCFEIKTRIVSIVFEIKMLMVRNKNPFEN